MSETTDTQDTAQAIGKADEMKGQLAVLLGERASVQLDLQNAVKIECSTQNLIDVLKILRDDASLQFRQLIDVTAVDYPERESRF